MCCPLSLDTFGQEDLLLIHWGTSLSSITKSSITTWKSCIRQLRGWRLSDRSDSPARITLASTFLKRLSQRYCYVRSVRNAAQGKPRKALKSWWRLREVYEASTNDLNYMGFASDPPTRFSPSSQPAQGNLLIRSWIVREGHQGQRLYLRSWSTTTEFQRDLSRGLRQGFAGYKEHMGFDFRHRRR